LFGHQSALHVAVINKHEGVVRTLLQAGANRDAQDKYGNTPLHEVNDLGVLHALLEVGADTQLKNKLKHSAYKHAVYRQLPEIAEVIKDAELEQIKVRLKREREAMLVAQKELQEVKRAREEKQRAKVKAHHMRMYQNFQREKAGKPPIKPAKEATVL
jgi:hypothetical protein